MGGLVYVKTSIRLLFPLIPCSLSISWINLSFQVYLLPGIFTSSELEGLGLFCLFVFAYIMYFLNCTLVHSEFSCEFYEDAFPKGPINLEKLKIWSSKSLKLRATMGHDSP